MPDWRDSISLFNSRALEYDEWYVKHRDLARSEEEAVKALGLVGRGIDVGAGSGFFTRLVGAVALDPSLEMSKIAKSRGLEVALGVGELMPIRDSSIDYVLIVVTLCFSKDPEGIIRESYRVLKNGGVLAACIIPLESPWGELYSRLRREGHPFYSRANLLTLRWLEGALTRVGFRIEGYVATLGRGVGEYFEEAKWVNESEASSYGFVCVKSIKVNAS